MFVARRRALLRKPVLVSAVKLPEPVVVFTLVI